MRTAQIQWPQKNTKKQIVFPCSRGGCAPRNHPVTHRTKQRKPRSEGGLSDREPPKCSAGKDARRTGSQDGRATTARFMGSEHLQNLDVSWGHEPLLVSPLPALSPQGGERVTAGRERGWFTDRSFGRTKKSAL